MNILVEIENLKLNGSKIGFTASSFDLMHPGHIAMLSEAKSKCDYLIVGLLTDPTISRYGSKNKPVQTTFERFIQAQALGCVDFIIPFDTEEDLEQMLKLIMPDIRFVGEEYKDKDHTGKNIDGIEIFYNKRKHNYSSSELRGRLK